MVWFRCVFDMFSDSTLSGWAKAGWALVLIFLPWLGALIYLIARGRSMTERQMAAVAEQRVRPGGVHPAGRGPAPTTPATQIADAKSLLDSGTIDQSEFDALKAKAMA